MEGMKCNGLMINTDLVSFGSRRALLSWVTLKREDRELKPQEGRLLLCVQLSSIVMIKKKKKRRDERTGGPSAPGIPGRPGFPVGP